MTEQPPPIDVVIPACGEGATIRPCLLALLDQLQGLDSRVVVVVNGPERAPTLAVAQSLRSDFEDRAVDLRILERQGFGKVPALNSGDALTRGGVVMYLDADAILLPNAIHAIIAALARSPTPRLVSPQPQIRPGRSCLTRQYARVLRSLPAVAGDVGGTGCYAVNATGRARWGAFPDLISDDGFVRSRFTREEREITTSGGIEFALPEGLQLVLAVRRWRVGNVQLRRVASIEDSTQGSDPRAGLWRNLLHVGWRRDLWPSLPGFALIWLLSHVVARGEDYSAGWRPAR